MRIIIIRKELFHFNIIILLSSYQVPKGEPVPKVLNSIKRNDHLRKLWPIIQTLTKAGLLDTRVSFHPLLLGFVNEDVL